MCPGPRPGWALVRKFGAFFISSHPSEEPAGSHPGSSEPVRGRGSRPSTAPGRTPMRTRKSGICCCGRSYQRGAGPGHPGGGRRPGEEVAGPAWRGPEGGWHRVLGLRVCGLPGAVQGPPACSTGIAWLWGSLQDTGTLRLCVCTASWERCPDRGHPVTVPQGPAVIALTEP